MELIEKAGNALIQSAATGKTIEPLRNDIGSTDIDLAYQIQEYVRKHRIQNGGVLVGKKIGLTSFAVQKQLGVDQPDFGMLFNDTMIPNKGTVPYSELMQPKAEAELAFVLKSDLSAKPSETEVRNAIDYVVSSIEIVGSRIRDWDIRITDTIADNASASHFVLGTKKRKLAEVDLIGCKMTMKVNDEIRSTGIGEACLGNPLNAVLWLASEMGRRGTPLKAGDVLLSGALGPMVSLQAGDFVSSVIEGFDVVEFSCT